MDYVKIIDEIAKQLGIAKDTLLPYYIRYYTIDAITGILFGLLLAIASIYLIFKIKPNDPEDDDKEAKWILMGVLCVPLILGMFLAFMNLPVFLAPEAYSFTKLIELVRGR